MTIKIKALHDHRRSVAKSVKEMLLRYLRNLSLGGSCFRANCVLCLHPRHQGCHRHLNGETARQRLPNIGGRARERSILLLTFGCDWSEAGSEAPTRLPPRSPTGPVSDGCTRMGRRRETPDRVPFGLFYGP